MPPSNQAAPFGTYLFKGIKNIFHQLAMTLPKSWIGQRVAYILRKAALYDKSTPIVDVTIDGLKLRLYPFDNLTDRYFLFLSRFFDQEEQQFMNKVLKNDSVFLDIGSNSGLYTLLASKKITNGKIIAFEPHPTMFNRLKVNIKHNQLDQLVRLKDFGIADEENSFEMSINPENLGGNSIALTHADKSEYLEKRIIIQCKPLADVLKAEKINHIDLLKIDIEEAEHLALIPFFDKANPSLFPKYIIIESDDKIDFGKYGYKKLTRTKSHNSIYQIES